MVSKFLQYLLVSTLLFSLSGCVSPTSQTTLSQTQKSYLNVPSSDCEIRKWYNYQVVAISVINKRWIENGIVLKERAKKAYTLRHHARINARFMMKDRDAVKILQKRDIKKYGNPDGPTFLHLVKKVHKKGFKGNEIYRQIIKSSSRTSPTYNGKCIDK